VCDGPLSIEREGAREGMLLLELTDCGIIWKVVTDTDKAQSGGKERERERRITKQNVNRSSACMTIV